MLPLTVSGLLVVGAGIFVGFALWPTWPGAATPLEAPAIPTTVAGVLFDVPPAAIRNAVQRHTGPQTASTCLHVAVAPASICRSNTSDPDSGQAAVASDGEAAPDAAARFFVTIAPLGPVLPPLERHAGVYPHYVDPKRWLAPDGLAILPFRKGRRMPVRIWFIWLERRSSSSPGAHRTSKTFPGPA